MNDSKGTYALAVPAGIFLLLYGLISVICMLGFFATPVLETFLLRPPFCCESCRRFPAIWSRTAI